MSMHKLLQERPWLIPLVRVPELMPTVQVIDELFLHHAPASVSYNPSNGTANQWQEIVWISQSGKSVGGCIGVTCQLDEVRHDREAPNYDGRTVGESLLDITGDVSEIAEAVEITRFLTPGGGIRSAQVVIRQRPKRFTLREWLDQRSALSRPAIDGVIQQLRRATTATPVKSVAFKNRFMVGAACAAIDGLRADPSIVRVDSISFESPTQGFLNRECFRWQLDPPSIWLFGDDYRIIEQIQRYERGTGKERWDALAARHTHFRELLGDNEFRRVRAIGIDQIYGSGELIGRSGLRHFTYLVVPDGYDITHWIENAPKDE